MKDKDKTKELLIDELEELRKQVTELKKSETKLRRVHEELKESEQRFTLLYERAPLGYQSLNENGYFIEVNQAFLDMLGYSREEVIDKWFGDFLHPDYVSIFKDKFPRFKEVGETHNAEFVMLKKDGSYTIVSINGKIGYDENGNFKQTHCILQDITERKKMEEQIKESKEFLENIFKTSVDAIIVTDLQGTITMVNDTVENITGYSQDELLGEYVAILSPPDETIRAEAEEEMQKFIKSGRKHGRETVWQGKNGQLIYVESNKSLIKDKDGQIVGAMAISRDITKRRELETALEKNQQELEKKVEKRTASLKITNEQLQQEINIRTQTEEELWKSKEKFSSLVTNIPGVVYRCAYDQDWTMEFISDEIEKLSGYPASDFIKNAVRSYASIIHPDDRQMVEDTVLDGVNHNLPYTIEYRVITRGDSTRWVYERGKATKDESGGVACLDGAIFDITERKQAEEELKKTTDHLDNIIESSLDSIIVTDDMGYITRVNPSFLQLLGYREEEVIGTHMIECAPMEEGYYESTTGELIHINEKFYDSMKNSMNKLLKDGKVVNRETYYFTKEKKVVHVEDSLVFLSNNKGEQIGAVAIARDITERKKAEKEIKEGKDFLESIIEGSRDGIVISDEKGYIISVNTALEKMCSFRKEELIRKHSSTLTIEDKDMREKIRKKTGELFEKGFTSYEAKHKVGEEDFIDVECNISMIKDEKGNYIAGVSIIRDITERKQAEGRFIQYQNRLKSLASQLTLTEEQDRKKFATYLHDQIGQRLFSLKLKMEEIRNSGYSSNTAESFDDSFKIITQLMKDTHSLTFDLSPPILYQFGLEAAVEWLTEQTSEQYGIMVAFEDDEQEKELNDDIKIFLFQAVRELLLNVVKHAKTQNAKVSIKRDNTQIRICVEDNGVGFTPSSRDVSKAANEGFGIFSIGERLDHLGGHFEIKSQPDCGTQATLVASLKGKKKI